MRNLVWFLAVAALAVAGAACGGDGGSDVPAATETSAPDATSTPEEEATPTPAEDAGGGAFRSDAYGYAFSYPEDWEHIQEEVTIQAETGGGALDTQIFGELNEDTLALNGLGVTVRQLSVVLTEDDLDEAFAELDGVFADLVTQVGGTLVETSSGELAGIPARRYVLDFLYAEDAPTRSEYLIVFTGDLQYETNCQAEEALFAAVREGCQQVWDSFTIETP